MRSADDRAELAVRDARKVLEDHLDRRDEGDLEADLARNYHPDVLLLSAEGVNRGHDGVRALAAVLDRYIPRGQYSYRRLLTDGEIGMLEWSGHFYDGEEATHDGVDSFVIQDGLIVAQTIHFSSYAGTAQE